MSNTQKWEYATLPLVIHATKQILDQWGDDGWELVTVIPGPDGNAPVAYLKRPKAYGRVNMSAIEQRIEAAGYPLPAVGKPLAAYVPTMRDGDNVYTSGQLPLVDGKLAGTGKVGETVSTEDAAR